MSTSKSMSRKSKRIEQGEAPRVLDLFAGCGGLTLGFNRAGALSIGGVELDPHAAASHARNFHGGSPIHAEARDICASDPRVLLESWSLAAGERIEVDVIVAGPPCPTFTRVGRAKLREVAQHPEAFKVDKRTELYLHFLRFVEALEPLAVVVENVPDILNHGGVNVGEVIAIHLEALGYDTGYSLLNSANYGVPQMRERFFLIGMRRELAASIRFPIPTHSVTFPKGYEGTRDVALRLIREAGTATQIASGSEIHFVVTPPAPLDAPPPISAAEAMGDLPAITKHLEGKDRRGARRFEIGVPYEPPTTPSVYAKQLLEWPGFESDGCLYDHVTRCLSTRDYRLFAQMQPGDDYPKAYRLAERLWREQSYGDPRRRAEFVPPYDATKFPNKWRKMEPDLPARTLMAHLGKDTYSHIHFDSTQARTISVREAARLQSFPDGFRFNGTMNPAFRQIGNSVPPLLAAAIGREVVETLSEACGAQGRQKSTSA
jgi:DNA (cytosine-5)-methyltransferase 1